MNRSIQDALAILMEETYRASKEGRLEDLRRIKREIGFIRDRLDVEIDIVHTDQIHDEMW